MENVFAQRSSDITEPADEVALIAHELESQGRFGLTRGFIQHGDVSVYHHMLSVARASLAAARVLERIGVHVDRVSVGTALNRRSPVGAAALVCSVIEYTVSALLERLAGARFWDYSKFPFNIKGRVCLYGAALFGAGAVIVCRVAEPALLAAMQLIPSLALKVNALGCAAYIAIDTVFAVVSWRQLSQKLELLRIEIADKFNDSLKDASTSLIDKVPVPILDSAAELKARSRALNSWLTDMSDGTFEAVRGRVELPSFIAEGTRGLRLVARHAHGIATRTEKAAPEKLKTMMTRRELRFFNAFPEIKLKSYEGVIRATKLKERARELFHRD